MAALDLSNIDASKLTEEEIERIELGFFKKVKSVDTSRDYTVIVDMSGSMTGQRWEDARAAVKHLAPHVCKCDPDGITLYFFDHTFQKYSNIKSADLVEKAFSKHSPRGSTDLAKVLADAVPPDDAVDGCGCFGSSAVSVRTKGETILVITDGTPNSTSAVEQVIIDATKRYMTKDEDLSITIIQIGNDAAADRWLKELDDDLVSKGAAFDIVDVMPSSAMAGMSFGDFIAKSLRD